jgi:hypothetical protein
MTKTFTCRELGGICHELFSGETVKDVIQKAMPHMMTDEVHKAAVMAMEASTGENKEQWMARMQNVFDTKPEDD